MFTGSYAVSLYAHTALLVESLQINHRVLIGSGVVVAKKEIYLHKSLCRNMLYNYIFQGNFYTFISTNKDKSCRFHSSKAVCYKEAQQLVK